MFTVAVSLDVARDLSDGCEDFLGAIELENQEAEEILRRAGRGISS